MELLESAKFSVISQLRDKFETTSQLSLKNVQHFSADDKKFGQFTIRY